MPRPFKKIHVSVMLLCACAAALLFFISRFLPDATLVSWGAEEGAIEVLASSLFLMAGGAGFGAYAVRHSDAWGLYGFFLVVAAMREMDWHKKFTSLSVFKPKLYLLDSVPLGEKIGAGLFMAVFMTAAFHVLRRFPAIWRAFWNGAPHIVLAVGGCGLLTIAKFMDGFYRYVPEKMAVWAGPFAANMRFTEESLEMTAGLFFIAAPLWFLRNAQKTA